MECSVSIPDISELIMAREGGEADCKVIWHNESDHGIRSICAPRFVTPVRKLVIQADTPQEKLSPLKRPARPAQDTARARNARPR